MWFSDRLPLHPSARTEVFWFRTRENKSLRDVFCCSLGPTNSGPSFLIFFYVLWFTFCLPFSLFTLLSSSLSLPPTEWFCVLRCKGLGTSSRNFIRHSTDWLPLEKPAVFFFVSLFSPPSLFSFLFLLMFGWVLFVRLPLLKAALSKAAANRCGCVCVCEGGKKKKRVLSLLNSSVITWC